MTHPILKQNVLQGGQRVCRRSRQVHRGRAMVLGAALTVGILAGPVFCQTWSVRSVGVYGNLADVVFSSASTAIAVGADPELAVSGNGGSSWVLGFNAGSALQAVFSAASTVVATGIRDGGNEQFIVSGDRAGSWTQLAPPVIPGNNRDFTDGVFVNASVAVAVDDANDEIYRSVDGGASWTLVATAADALNAVDSRGSTVVAVGNNEALEYSADAGATWPGVTTGAGTGANMNDVVMVSSSVAVAVGDAGEVIRSTDGGDNWSNVYDVALGPDMNAVTSRGLYVLAVGNAAGGASTIVYSSDGGANWAPATINAPVPNQPLQAVLQLTSATCLAVGDNGTILGSTDGGLTWDAQTSPTIQQLTALAFNNGNRVVAVGAGGVILLSADQIDVGQPIPFQSKWLLVLLLVGYGVWTLHRKGLV